MLILSRIAQYLAVVMISVCLFSCQEKGRDGVNAESPIKTEQSITNSEKIDDNVFLSASSATKPLTWFHAMSGNMSKEGVTKDLESLAEVGIGGALLFNVTQGIPIGDVKFNSDRHIDIIQHMAAESERLGLSFGIHNADGWTSSGGPWIKPEHSMKKLVWSQKLVDGEDIAVTMPQPLSLHNYYEDVALIAYPAMPSDIQDDNNKPIVTASNLNFVADIVSDGLTDSYTEVSANDRPNNSEHVFDALSSQTYHDFNELPWIQFEYPDSVEIRSVNGQFYEGRGLKFFLYTSSDGKTFTQHQAFPTRRPGKRIWASDASLKPASAKYFRVYANKSFKVQEMSLSAAHLLDNFLGRTSIARTNYVDFKNIGTPDSENIIKSSSVIDLSQYLKDTGEVRTKLPKGKWNLMRFGYTTTGAVNIPASKEGTGLEVDKFSREAFDVHYGAYVSRAIEASKAVAPKATQFIEIDSYEVGGQNWTQGYEQKFQSEYDYNLIKFLPLFAGKFVDSATISEAVLWDTRRLNAKLIVDNYYDYFTELANKDGLQTYIEPYGFGPFNDVDAGAAADIPMGEFWLKRENYKISAAASAAHIYDKNIVSAEAFTAQPQFNWRFHPAMAKVDGDRAYALGVNEMMFHRFAHQANTHVMPGMTMNRWGSHFDRTQTWWTGAGKAWFTYMTRVQYMLRQGKPVADLLWYLGDASPTACPDKHSTTDIIPAIINYDCINSDALVNKLSAGEQGPTLGNGQHYKWMYLRNIDTLSMESAKALFALSKQGVVMVGKKPTSLSNWRASEQEKRAFQEMVDFIWSQKTTHSEPDWQALYRVHNIKLDMSVKGNNDAIYAHRKTNDEDIYFIYNPDNQPKLYEITFNVSNKIPELFDALTGKVSKHGVFVHNSNGTTTIQLYLTEHESTFVVFRESSQDSQNVHPSKEMALKLSTGLTVELSSNNQLKYFAKKTSDINDTLSIQVKAPVVLDMPWQVSFSERYGLNSVFEFDKLEDWAAHPNVDIQNYSGKAQYTTEITIEESWLDDHEAIYLDLGHVEVSAKVSINNTSVGTSWMPPHLLEVKEYLKVGKNEVQIEIANLWVNRLIADESLPDTSGYQVTKVSNNPSTPMVQWYKDNVAPPQTERVTFTTQPFFKADDKKVESGLLGPVSLVFENSASVD